MSNDNLGRRAVLEEFPEGRVINATIGLIVLGFVIFGAWWLAIWTLLGFFGGVLSGLVQPVTWVDRLNRWSGQEGRGDR